MNKAETVKQLAKQTIEREQDLKTCLLNESREIKRIILLEAQRQDIIQKMLLEIKASVKERDHTSIVQELLKTKKEYKKMKTLIVISYLTLLVPFLALLVALLVAYLIMT